MKYYVAIQSTGTKILGLADHGKLFSTWSQAEARAIDAVNVPGGGYEAIILRPVAKVTPVQPRWKVELWDGTRA